MKYIFSSIYLLLLSPLSFALNGVYLDKSEHIDQVCKIVGIDMVFEKTEVFIEQKMGPHGQNYNQVHILTPKTIVTKPVTKPLCSATVIGANAVLTAAHCYEKHITRFIPNPNEYGASYSRDKKRKLECDKNGQNCAPSYNCMKPNWAEIPYCYEYGPTYLVKTKIPRVELHCPNGEVKELEWERGWPHPYFDGTNPIYFGTPHDVAVLKTTTPFLMKPLEVVYDLFEVQKVINESPMCKILGYGYNSTGAYGTLHAVRMQPNHVALNRVQLTYVSGVNHVLPGDSGSSVTCRDNRGNHKVIGVVSSTTLAKSFSFFSDYIKSFFALPAAGQNKRWIQFVINDIDNNFTHQFNRQDKHVGVQNFDDLEAAAGLEMYVANYKKNREMPGLIDELSECVKMIRTVYPRSHVKGYEDFLSKMKIIFYDVFQEYKQMLNPETKTIKILDTNLSKKQGQHEYYDYYYELSFLSAPEGPAQFFDVTAMHGRFNPALKALKYENDRCWLDGMGNTGNGHITLPKIGEAYFKYMAKHYAQKSSFRESEKAIKKIKKQYEKLMKNLPEMRDSFRSHANPDISGFTYKKMSQEENSKRWKKDRKRIYKNMKKRRR